MDWSHRLIDTLGYKAQSSVSDGDITYGSLVSFTGRLEEYPSIVRGTSGEDIVTSHRVATETDVPPDALVWTNTSQASDASKSLRVLEKRKAKTLDGGYTLYILKLGR